MRKEKKKQALEFVKLLEQAYDEIQVTIEENIPAALDLLEQCQQGAIELGTMIEESEGEGFITVKLLEEYCELIYQTHQAILKASSLNSDKTYLNNSLEYDVLFQKAYKTLPQMLNKIENSVNNDIKVRKEIVFLPYKASMWDSLESVWKAADEDPDCDVYVIPIPYYDKNPDGSFKTEHYEGYEYPNYVPITHYNEYDFKRRHPEMTFIHYPYDEHNIVTSVHPFFYSKKLKQYTDQLVYIPYFIMDEIMPDNLEAVENVKHFCLEPACLHAHRVIVQSEAIRQIYINVLTEAMGESTRLYWEEKILGIGSPKIDKVVSMKKEDCYMPKEWLKIIEKPDGSWKKVVFYNISLTTLLEQKEKMLNKVKDVLSLFKKNQESIVLLWRPHPLMRETIESMRPQLLSEYDKIIEQYKSEGWGIYDDTPDINRAIALSDAYYGTDSSVVNLYEATGKPIMIQNVEVLSDDERDFV